MREENIVKNVIEKLDSILNGDAEQLVETADKFGEHLSRGGLSTSQIRNIFNDVKKMNRYDKDKLNLLRPKIAYIAGRHGGMVKDLQRVLDNAIQKTNDEKKFNMFKEFFEAILAYHKYYGGKD